MSVGFIPKKSSDGLHIYAPSFEWDGDLNGRWKGQRYVASAGVLNIFDELITSEVKLRGGWYELLDDPTIPKATNQDYIEFSVVDKDDVLGLFSTYGLTVGEDVLEISKFVVKDYINPYHNNREMFNVSSASTIVAGLYMRTYYYSNGAQDVTFKRIIHYYEE